MRRAWRVWLSTSSLLLLYISAGWIESSSFETSVRLEPGYTTTVMIPRLADDPLSMSLVFAESNNHRPELGFPQVAKPWPASNEKHYLRPGAAIRLTASAGSQSVLYEAEPPPALFMDGGTSRPLTSNISIAPGVWRWPPPPDLPKIVLHPGVTKLKIDIVSVEPPLAGQPARLFIYPPIHLKRSKENVGWVGLLWFAQLWPIFAIVQLLWAAVIVLVSLLRRG